MIGDIGEPETIADLIDGLLDTRRFFNVFKQFVNARIKFDQRPHLSRLRENRLQPEIQLAIFSLF